MYLLSYLYYDPYVIIVNPYTCNYVFFYTNLNYVLKQNIDTTFYAILIQVNAATESNMYVIMISTCLLGTAFNTLLCLSVYCYFFIFQLK